MDPGDLPGIFDTYTKCFMLDRQLLQTFSHPIYEK